MTEEKKYRAIVAGTSAGGLYALTTLLEKLPVDYPLPVIVVQHRSKSPKDLLEEVLQSKCAIKIRQADEKEEIRAGFVYVAPPDYHLLIEEDETFSLSADEYVNFSRPSIDVLFESAAGVYKDQLISILLTGANADGAAGTAAVTESGGLTIVQDPLEAEYPVMPQAAIDTGKAQCILRLDDIRSFLLNLSPRQNEN